MSSVTAATGTKAVCSGSFWSKSTMASLDSMELFLVLRRRKVPAVLIRVNLGLQCSQFGASAHAINAMQAESAAPLRQD